MFVRFVSQAISHSMKKEIRYRNVFLKPAMWQTVKSAPLLSELRIQIYRQYVSCASKVIS